MTMVTGRFNRALQLVCLSLLLECGLSCDLPGDDSAATATTGVLKGVVKYVADPARPWRLGRYYIKDRSTGALAEAVVALDRKGMPDPTRQPTTFIVDQRNFQFTPETVAIRAGDSVKFLNSDEASHNVNTSHLQHAFNITLAAGEVHVEKFHFATGIRRPYFIGCVFHSAMRCWIFVFDHPSFQLTEANGQFRFENLPPGEYSLEMFHPAGNLKTSMKVSVTAGATTELEIQVTPDDIVQKKQ